MLLLCHHSRIESEVPAVETEICTIFPIPSIVKFILLYRQECYGGKQTTRIVHLKLHPGLGWRISISLLASEDIDVVISFFYTVVCARILLSI